MPMLADLEDPPRPRLPQLLLGLLIAAAAAAIIIGWLLPWLSGSVLSGARDFDERARAQHEYMKTLCATALDFERDADLCACVLAVDYPALDCQLAFTRWTVERQFERCADERLARRHEDFCECVGTFAAEIAAAPEAHKRSAAAGYTRCESLPDALPVPSIDEDGALSSAANP